MITIVKTINWVDVYVNNDLFVSRIAEIEPGQWILLGQQNPNIDAENIRYIFPNQGLLINHKFDYVVPSKLCELPINE